MPVPACNIKQTILCFIFEAAWVKGDVTIYCEREGTFNCEDGTGNLTALRQKATDADTAVTTIKYDNYGNISQITGAANDANHDISGSAQSLILEFDYDTVTNTYPVTVRNVSYGLQSSTLYDYKFGKALCTLDTNGNPMRNRYDSFGRMIKVIGPYEQAEACDTAIDNAAPDNNAGPFTIKFSYQPYVNLAQPRALSMAKTEHYNRDAAGNAVDTIDTWLFVDGLKRVLQTKKTASIDQGDGTTAPDRIVSGRVSFDALGRSVRQYYPTLDGNNAASEFNVTLDSIAPTEMKYDALDRNISTILPDTTETSIDYGFGSFTDGSLNNYFTTTVTDATGKQKHSYRDIRELIHGVKEEGDLLTRYAYDPLKQITDVWDAKDNHTTVGYDNLGRRTSINNPDTGNTQYKYDLAGNLIEKITANRKDQTGIQYFYDHSRLIDIRYPSFSDNNVSYRYGDANDQAKNQAGRITQVTHQSGTERKGTGSDLTEKARGQTLHLTLSNLIASLASRKYR